MAPREWILKRNCSMSPRQLATAYAALWSISMMVAVSFAMRGAWLVLGYACLELLAVGIAFLMYARHAVDRERIELGDAGLLVELIRNERVTQFRLDPFQVHVELVEDGRQLVALRCADRVVEIGRYITERKRREIARELQSALASHRRTEFQF